jgi:uncharacterized 2Fe-2S/4Fe-4S cluster protein (DUF4445 family)
MNIKIDVILGSNLFQVARNNNIDISGICSGNKTCGKCRVIITKGNDKNFCAEELNTLTEDELQTGMRLACCFTISSDTCVIIPGGKRLKSKEIIKFNNDITGNSYGAIIDIGTTTVEAELYDINKNNYLIGQISVSNPQRSYGSDVISRITYASTTKENQKKLTELIRTCCNEVIESLCNQHKINPNEIVSIVIAGNTTMSQLFLGNSVECLFKVPFQGVSYNGVKLEANKVNINRNEQSYIYVMPGIGGHVGADTLGCILAMDLYQTTNTVLLVDIGTNGEIVLAKGGKLTVCSTAAGPAFEGASLHQGMRAEEGAITNIEIKNGKPVLQIVGGDNENVSPIGICGSGVIEIISELYKHNILDETGRLLGQSGENNYYELWNKNNQQVILTQKDIREIQLAKGAIYAGIMTLLNVTETNIHDIDHIYLAGAFGSNVNLRKAIHIGLLPNVDLDKISYIGNGALKGAKKILFSDIHPDQVEGISKSIQHLELASYDGFQEEFIKSMNFPV